MRLTFEPTEASTPSSPGCVWLIQSSKGWTRTTRLRKGGLTLSSCLTVLPGLWVLSCPQTWTQTGTSTTVLLPGSTARHWLSWTRNLPTTDLRTAELPKLHEPILYNKFLFTYVQIRAMFLCRTLPQTMSRLFYMLLGYSILMKVLKTKQMLDSYLFLLHFTSFTCWLVATF